MRKNLYKTFLNLYSFAVECDSLYTKHRNVFHFATFFFFERVYSNLHKKIKIYFKQKIDSFGL